MVIANGTWCLPLNLLLVPRLRIYIYIYTHTHTHTGWSKSICAPDDYSTKKNMQKYFKQFQSLIMIM
jgi:hypothetical protein